MGLQAFGDFDIDIWYIMKVLNDMARYAIDDIMDI